MSKQPEYLYIDIADTLQAEQMLNIIINNMLPMFTMYRGKVNNRLCICASILVFTIVMKCFRCSFKTLVGI